MKNTPKFFIIIIFVQNHRKYLQIITFLFANNWK
jgi:hypothetical protein